MLDDGQLRVHLVGSVPRAQVAGARGLAEVPQAWEVRRAVLILSTFPVLVLSLLLGRFNQLYIYLSVCLSFVRSFFPFSFFASCFLNFLITVVCKHKAAFISRIAFPKFI